MHPPAFYKYSGNINELITRDIISDFRVAIKHIPLTLTRQKKCTYILQEAVNNILNYYKKNNFLDDRKCKISCRKEEDDNAPITLEFTSDIYKADVAQLEKRFLELNAMQKPGLQKEFHSTLNAPMLKENSANLGLLTIMIKADNKLKYQFIDIDDVFCTFTLVNYIN